MVIEERRLEQAQQKDADEVFALYRRTVESGTSAWDDEYPGMQEIQFDLSEGGLYILREKGKIIAAVSIVDHDDLDEEPMDWSEGKSCALARLCVEPQIQGQGIGKKMVESAMRLAKSLGYEWIRLLVDEKNGTAERLYQRLGFRKTGETDLYGSRFRAYECRI